MALIDFLKNVGNKVGNIQSKVGSSLGEALIGKQELPVDYVNIKGVDVNSPEFAENAPIAEIGVTEAPRVGGLLNDIRSGAKENFATGFAAPNWEQTVTPDGRKKGLGYRFGEGLGSIARLAESPLGRGLLMAGIVGASGGSGLEALGYGTGAGLLNQQSRMRDKMYRNELEKMGFDTTGITGYVGDDTFNKIYQSKQLQDNAEYRNAMLASQQRNQMLANKLAEDRLEYQKVSDAADRALKKEQIDVQRQRYVNNLNKLSSKDLTAYRDNLATIKDVEAGLNLIEQNPNAYSLVKGALPAWATNRIDPKGIQTRTQIDNITAVYRKWLTGAQMSDAERKAYERFLPAPTDNYETIKAKLQGMRDSIERKNSILMQGANEYQNMIDTEDNDPLGVR
jgi:hypothetical protein